MFSGTDASSPELSLCLPYGPWTQGHGPTEQLGLALLQCAAHVEAGPMEKATRCLARATGLAAAAGDGPRKRLAVAMVDCLARRLLRPVHSITDVLIDPSGYLDRRSVRAARRWFFELSPFPKVAFVVGNRAIVEAVENESLVHVFGMSGPFTQPCQWIQLLHELRRRPEGPPRAVRLTVVHDDGEFLAKMAELVSDEADELGMELKFHAVVGQLEDLNFSNLHGVLEIKSGEALAVSCTLQLHRLLAAADDLYSSRSAHLNQMASIAQLQHMAASSCPPSSCGASVQCKDDDDSYRSPGTPLAFVSPPASTPHFQMPAPLASFLSAVRALSPKIVVVAEQDADHNGVSFRKRFCEALHHYVAVFDSLDAAAVTASAASHLWPPDERAQVERVVVGEEIKGVLLRDGAHRRERHDRLRQWTARMEMAGFTGVPLSYVAIRKGNDMVKRCGLRRCENKECGGCLLLCWSSRPLYSVSAWRPAASRGPGSGSGRSEPRREAAESLVDLSRDPGSPVASITRAGVALWVPALFPSRSPDQPIRDVLGLRGALIDPSDYFEQSTLRAARCNFFKLNPYLSTGFVTINRAIMGAMEDEKVKLQVVHIVDLSCSASHPWQWLKLLDDFHGRPGGVGGHLNYTLLFSMMTTSSCPTCSHCYLRKLNLLRCPSVLFVIGRLDTLDFSNFRSTFQIKFGVAVAISCALQMHRLLLVDDNLSSTSIAQLQKMANFTQPKQMASSVCSPASTLNYLQTPSPRTPKLLARLLSAIRALKPNIMVIMEQDADHNTLLFRDWFMRYSTTMLSSLTASMQWLQLTQGGLMNAYVWKG
uniref:Scarecrow-like protein 3 n=1 Tax=Oryza punctata TaxID=4537 RepID=A0A0E0MJG6_ORYPU